MKSKKKRHHFLIIYLVVLFNIVLILSFCTNYKEKNAEKENKQHQLSILMDSINADDIYHMPKKLLSRIPEAISLANELKDSISLCQILIIKAGCFIPLDQVDSTFFVAQQALKIAKSINNDTLLAKSDNLMGIFYTIVNDYVTAANFFTKALGLMEKSGNNSGKVLILNNLGNIYWNIGEHRKSIECYTETLSVFDSVHDKFKAALIYLNLSGAYMEINDSSNVRRYYKKSFDIFKKYGDTLQLAKLLINQSLFYKNIGKIDSAIIALNLVLDYSIATENKRLHCMALYNLGSIYYYQLNDLEQARHFIEKSLSIRQEGSLDLKLEMKTFLTLSDIENNVGNYKMGNDFFRKYVSLKDSIEGWDVKKEIITIELKNDLQKQEYEAELLQRRLELKGKQNTILFISLFAFLLLIIMVILIIRASYNNLKKSNIIKELENQRLEEQMEIDRKISEIEKLKLNAELDAKNKELVSYSLKLVTKNDLLNKISKLSDKYYNDNALDRYYYNDLTKIIEENLNVDKEWNQFKALFEKVHHGFFERLKHHSPNLTEHDLRVCSYIKINLRPKEIALLLNISSDSVKKFRNRLKKKLALDINIGLDDFIRSI